MKCIIEWCTRPKRYSDGYCATHHARSLNNTDMNIPIGKWGVNKNSICITDGCGKVVHSRGMCKNCYGKWSKGITPGTGRMKGVYSKEKRQLPTTGYIVWHDKNSPHANAHGHVYEHRHVMGEYIGRPLMPCENVHHINGDRADNRIENLELWNTSQPPGQRWQDKVKWAKEILSLYDGRVFRG